MRVDESVDMTFSQFHLMSHTIYRSLFFRPMLSMLVADAPWGAHVIVQITTANKPTDYIIGVANQYQIKNIYNTTATNQLSISILLVGSTVNIVLQISSKSIFDDDQITYYIANQTLA